MFKFCEPHNIDNKDWFQCFIKRYLDISEKKSQFMIQARAHKLNKFIVDDHFKRLNAIHVDMDLESHSERIYNIDDESCPINMYWQRRVLKERIYNLRNRLKVFHSRMCKCTWQCSVIIFKGEILKPELYDNLPPGSLIEKSAEEYMTNEILTNF